VIAVVDVETSGKRSPNAQVIEVAAVVFRGNFEKADTFASLVNPGEEAIRLADPEALAVNHITHGMMRSAPAIDKVARELESFLDRHWGTTIHSFNVEFDHWFLLRPPWNVASRRWGECIMLAAMETMNRAGALERFTNAKPKWPKLSEAAAFFKVPASEEHRALGDALKAASVYAAILGKREEENAVDEARQVMEQGY
jgi:DNA polymerase III epsilon subunit-like protein